jgi:transcriptional regulator with XRE-family HTH domain
MAPKTTMGTRIESARHAAGLNKNQLARAVGTSWQHVDHWERDRMQPNAASLQRLASVLGVPLGHLLGDAGPGPTATGPALHLFLERYAPADLTGEEIAWLRSAPVDPSGATPGMYLDLLHRIRDARQGTPAEAARPAPAKSGARAKAQPTAEAIRAARERRR